MEIYSEAKLRSMSDSEILAYEEKLSEHVKSLPDTERVRTESETGKPGTEYLRKETKRSRYDAAFLTVKLVKEQKKGKH